MIFPFPVGFLSLLGVNDIVILNLNSILDVTSIQYMHHVLLKLSTVSLYLLNWLLLFISVIEIEKIGFQL